MSSENVSEIKDCYSDDIFKYLLSLESNAKVPKDYLQNIQPNVNEKMRAIMIDWLVSVHDRFILRYETLFLTVNVFDRYLSKVTVDRKKLQLVGITAMLIAAKYEEMYPPDVSDYIYICESAYSRNDILNMEQNMLKVIDYSLSNPTCLHFFYVQPIISCDSINCGTAGAVSAVGNTDSIAIDKAVFNTAKYLMELALDMDSLDYLPSQITVSAIHLAYNIIEQQMPQVLLDSALIKSHSLDDIKPCMDHLGYLLTKTNINCSTTKDKDYCIGVKPPNVAQKCAEVLDATRKKFARAKLMQISIHPKVKDYKVQTI